MGILKKTSLFCLLVFLAASAWSCGTDSRGGAAGGKTRTKSPEVFKVRFETSKGEIVIQVHRAWAPRGADRFRELVEAGFFDGCRFFRVVPGFVVQFGLNGDPKLNAKWRNKRIPDDPVLHENLKGTITFATAGPNTRTTQLFINLVDNTNLDSMGFSPFGEVVKGMDVVEKIYAGYGERPQQPMIEAQGNAYLQKEFPKLDYIKKAEIL